MTLDRETIIRRALAEAQTAGDDHVGQIELADRAVLNVRPDMMASEALTAVEVVRRSVEPRPPGAER